MNYVTIGIGALMIAYGFFVLTLRIKNDTSKLSKLAKMKEIMGEKKGSVIHLIGYAILPMAAGIVFVIMGFKGVSFF